MRNGGRKAGHGMRDDMEWFLIEGEAEIDLIPLHSMTQINFQL